MTDREKAFVMNGLRNHILVLYGEGSPALQATHEKLVIVAKRLQVPPELLEETRLEGQKFLALVLTIGEMGVGDGN
jgi:hypothetical protein